MAYYQDFVKSTKKKIPPAVRQGRTRRAGGSRRRAAQDPGDSESAEFIQNEVYEAGKAAGFEPLRAWFQALYEVLLGQNQGPRFGSFVAIFGVERTLELVERALATTLPS